MGVIARKAGKHVIKVQQYSYGAQWNSLREHLESNAFRNTGWEMH